MRTKPLTISSTYIFAGHTFPGMETGWPWPGESVDEKGRDEGGGVEEHEESADCGMDSMDEAVVGPGDGEFKMEIGEDVPIG